jgi:hypothetical protein
MEKLKQKAYSLGAEALGKSNAKGKRFYVKYKGQTIHFGAKEGSTFIDHKDEKKRKAWRARHSKIRDKQGRLVYKLKTSSSYWSWNLLWIVLIIFYVS